MFKKKRTNAQNEKEEVFFGGKKKKKDERERGPEKIEKRTETKMIISKKNKDPKKLGKDTHLKRRRF